MRRLVIEWLKVALVHDHQWSLSDDDIALIRRHVIWLVPDAPMLTKNITESEADDDDDDDDDDDRHYTGEQAQRLRDLVGAASLRMRRLMCAFVESLSLARRRSEYGRALVAALRGNTPTARDRAVRDALVATLEQFELGGNASNPFVRMRVALHIQHDVAGKTLRGGTKLFLFLISTR